MRLPNVYLSVFDRSFQIDTGGNQPPGPPVSCNCTVADILGWFDVTAYGAVADFDLITSTPGTDNSQAFTDCIKAATDWSSPFAQRFGVVYIPPAPKGKGYGITSGVSLTISQGGTGTGGALHLDIFGCGADSPIVCNTGADVDTIYINVAGLEWFMGSVRNLAFVSSHLSTPGSGTDCYRALNLQASVGKWITDELHGIGVIAASSSGQGASIFRFSGANYDIGTMHNAGCTAYDTGRSFIHFDQASVCSLKSVFSFAEYLYQGIDNNIGALGGFNALVKVTPSRDTSWGPSAIDINNMHSDSRSDYAVYCYQDSGSIRAAHIRVSNFKCTPSLVGMLISDCDHIELVGGLWSAGASRKIVDAYNFTSLRLKNTTWISTGFKPDVQGDGTGTVYIEDSPVGTVTLNGGAGFNSTAGLVSRYRVSDAAITSNTLGKPAATDDRVTQLGTGDDARLALGVVLDTAASSGTLVRVVEQSGQQVQVKSDGATTLSPSDTLTASAASAGMVKKTTSAGASTVGLATASATNVTGTLVNMVWQRSQY